MTVTVYQGQIVAITRVYPGGKWCKLIAPHEIFGDEVEWVRSTDITEEEI